MKPSAILIHNLKKSYGDTTALKGIDIEINDGEIVGLLGPNGAGKTTTINILTGLVRKDSGSTDIFGQDTISNYRFTRAKSGNAAKECVQDWCYPNEKLRDLQAGYYGITKTKAKSKVDEGCERVGREKERQSRLRQLSGGMKRRFQIAKALVHDPKILILDEPTAGVDVKLRHELWQYFRELHQNGKTILLTTHYIEEAEMLCDQVAIIDNGEVITKGTPKNLTGKQGDSGITINLSETEVNLKNHLKEFSYSLDDERIHFLSNDPEGDLPKIINKLTKAGCQIQRVETTKSSLEDVFLKLTGKGINE